MTTKSELWAWKQLSRRNFLRLSSASPLALSAAGTASAREDFVVTSAVTTFQNTQAANRQAAIREFLNRRTCLRQEVETFLNPTQPNWARFDPELGYTLRDNILKDGIDGSRTITSYQKTGQRTMINYAHLPCRINTYGNSFTQGLQASDGETWQEYLAAHLGEPIRNFGIGGYGTYQAYRRMLREESGPLNAEYILLNIWDIDDYLRSINAWQWLRRAEYLWGRPERLYMFAGNPWVHIRLDLETGEAIERENAFSTPESLWKLADPEFVYEHFKDDLVVKLRVAEQNGAAADREELEALARALNVQADVNSPEATSATAHAVHIAYALRAGMKVIEKAQAFASSHHKKLMILLSCGEGSVIRACEGRPRVDQSVVDFLKEKKIPFVDGLSKHVEDFRSFELSPQAYVKRYYIGHYKPQGNHFFAFVIKDAVVDCLNPKPVAYRAGSETIPTIPAVV
ncbi:MAG: hypothetical protein HY508_06395 [Acidobacteria bacterium]|nr:hypothetical protein [Acidobacteriota bacterium]